jgi:hypothetical protein
MELPAELPEQQLVHFPLVVNSGLLQVNEDSDETIAGALELEWHRVRSILRKDNTRLKSR